MTKTRRIGLLCLLLSCGIFVLWGTFLERTSPGAMADFKAVFYGSRCLLHSADPYKESEFLRVYQEDGGKFPSIPLQSRLFRRAVTVCVNLPTSLFLMASFAILPMGPAHVLWMILITVSITFATFLVWDFGSNFAPGISLCLACIALANSETLLLMGNLAGIAVGLCVIGVWCFLKDRFVAAGILCLAVSLLLKPHDAGLVWLYFLLAGGVYRKRALQTAFVVVAFGLPAIVWVSHVAPFWAQELHSNLLMTSAHGDLSDPGPNSVTRQTTGMIIDLQSAISVLWDDPKIYNPASYFVSGALLLVWSIKTLRTRISQKSAWFALASIAALSMLVTYHRPYDAKLLLLTIPACAMLWAEGGAIRWVALLLNTAGVVLTSDIPLAVLVGLARNMQMSSYGLLRKISVILLSLPIPIILLLICAFYLWIYVRRASVWASAPNPRGPGETQLAREVA